MFGVFSFDFALAPIGRFVGSFHPSKLPPMLRKSYGQEFVAWWFLPITLGAIEGGVISVIVKRAFDDVPGVSGRGLNFAVAALTATPALANITSFLWASLSHGRTKIRFITHLQIITGILVGLIGLVPHSLFGLVALCLLVLGARICWTGVITIRTAVWRNNYPRADRARVAGKLASVQAIVLAVVAMAMGKGMDIDDRAFHVLFPIAAALGMIGVAIYSRLRLRGQRRLVRQEREGAAIDRPSINPLSLWRTLANDARYRRFMACMFVFGLGNIMLIAPTAIILRDQFHLGYLTSILITSAIPDILMPFTIPLWARLLDRVHVVKFRSIHSWAYVAVSITLLLAAVTNQVWLMIVMAVLLGVADGGGVLAWNLGHHDFADAHKSGQYMGVHVTLTGIRGLMAPFLAVTLYEMLNAWHPGAGVWTFALCFAFNFTGAIGFVRMSRSLGREAYIDRASPRPITPAVS